MFLSTPVKICVATLCLSPISPDAASGEATRIPRRSPHLSPETSFLFRLASQTSSRPRSWFALARRSDGSLLARDGVKRRIDYDPGTDEHRAVLITDKEYLLYFKRKRYEERDLTGSGASGDGLLSHLLHVRDFTEFEQMRRDGSVVQFRASINESNASEVIVFFDEAIGLPVKQEFYSVEGDKRTLRYSVELRDFKKEVEPGVFEIPAGFRK
jgi:hypothetical protein